MAYETYPVYDMKSGLRLDKEPWLIPQDAFESLEDCFIQNGVLEKRSGNTAFATFVRVNPAAFGAGLFGAGKFGIGRVTTSPGNAIMGIFNYSIGGIEKLLFWDTRRVNKYNVTTKVCDDLTTLNVRFKSGQTEIITGDTITGATSGDTAAVVGVVLDKGAWATSDASGTLILSRAAVGTFTASGENITVNGSTVAALIESCGHFELSGDDVDFIWFENWRGVGYFTNNQDQIRKYDGTYITRFNIDLDVEGGPDNDINTCLLIFHMKGRVILLRTTERGAAHPQRLRWGQINSTTFRDSDWTDADRDDGIITADFLNGELIVWFERGVQKIVYTGDPNVPFRWEDVDGVEGCSAKMSLINVSNEQIVVGPTRFLSCDGREVNGIDDKIPDLMLTFNQSAIDHSYGAVIEEMRQAIITYVSASATKPDKMLVLNYKENNFAIFNLPAHVIGFSSLQSTPSTDDMIGISLDDLDYSLDDKELQAGYPTTLIGLINGKVYRMNDGGSDDGSAIVMKALGARMNPYFKENRKARFQKVEFLVDRVVTTFDVQFFINSRTSSHLTKTVDCSDTDTQKKTVWRSATCGATADWHRIQIDHNTVGVKPRIHAMIFHFKPAGPIRG